MEGNFKVASLSHDMQGDRMRKHKLRSDRVVFAGVDESSLRSGLDLTQKCSPMVLLDSGPLEFKKNKTKKQKI